MEEQYYLGRNVIAEWMQSQQTKGSANILYTAQILVLLLLSLLKKASALCGNSYKTMHWVADLLNRTAKCFFSIQ